MQWLPIDAVKPWDRNPRHNDKAAKKLAAELRALAPDGDYRRVWTSPIAVQAGTMRIIAGHTRVKAARIVGMTEVPVKVLEVDDTEATRLTLADNRIGEDATWERDGLSALLSELRAEDASLVKSLGWSDPALERLLDGKTQADASRDSVQRYEVLIPCATEEEQGQRLQDLIAEGVDCSAITLRISQRKERPPPPANPIAPKRLEFARESRITQTPRVKQCAGLFDLPQAKVSRETWTVDVDLPAAWNIGLIVGPSGSGKSTLAAELFGVQPDDPWDGTRAVVDGFPADMSITDITELLSSVGFSSPPAWLRPFHVLSGGQQFRASLARLLAQRREISVMDEFTSVVDRTVAQIGSAAVARTVRASGQRFVAVTCHYDVADWLCPDWIIEMPSGLLTRGLLRRPSIELEIRRVGYTAWNMFRAHHYLTADINKSAACYVAFWRGCPVSFASVIPQMAQCNFRAHRSVCLPDFQGVGIGHALQAKVAAMYATKGDFTMKISAPAVVAHALRSPDWEMVGKPSRYVSDKSSESPRYGTSFRWCGPKDYAAAEAFGVHKPSRPGSTAPSTS